MHHNCKCEYCRQETALRERRDRDLPWTTLLGAALLCLVWIVGILAAWWVKP